MQKPTILKRIEARQEPRNETVIMKHKWRDLLFLHWEYDKEYIQSTLPDGLYVDTFNDKAYIGITPFFLHDLRLFFFPPIPFISNFPEVNIRTYVYDKNGIPGVWFYSLDADNPIAVKAAQQLKLPYKYAEIKTHKDELKNEISFIIKRDKSHKDLISKFNYIRNNGEYFADSESLDFFLVERYLLYTVDNNSKNLISCRVYHKPYPLYNIKLLEYDNNLIKLDNLKAIDKTPDHIIGSAGVDVNVYNFKKVN